MSSNHSLTGIPPASTCWSLHLHRSHFLLFRPHLLIWWWSIGHSIGLAHRLPPWPDFCQAINHRRLLDLHHHLRHRGLPHHPISSARHLGSLTVPHGNALMSNFVQYLRQSTCHGVLHAAHQLSPKHDHDQDLEWQYLISNIAIGGRSFFTWHLMPISRNRVPRCYSLLSSFVITESDCRLIFFLNRSDFNGLQLILVNRWIFGGIRNSGSGTIDIINYNFNSN